jgi:FkbM family methyltransferase
MDIIIQLFLYDRNSNDDSYIKYKKDVRESEYKKCFIENISRDYVNNVHVFLVNPNDEPHFKSMAGNYAYKCKFIHFGKQPNYKDFIEYIQTKLDDNRIVCIMNSDILLDKHMQFHLIKQYVNGLNMFGITRHNYTNETHNICNIHTCLLVHQYQGSHDMFLMHTPISKNIKLEDIDFKQNVYGAEAIFQKTLKNAGYSFKNPAFQIRGYHIHDNFVYFENYPTIGTDADFSQPPSILEIEIKEFIKNLDINVFVEVGCHNGDDTKTFREMHPNSRILCFEPDPRNLLTLEKNNIKEIAEIYPFALSNQNGNAMFFQSNGIVPDPLLAYKFGDWSLSSSLKMPTGHLQVHPWCKFENNIIVQTIRFDDFKPLKNTGIDFMWVDVQGAEDLVFSGATETLKRTRYLYTEYSNAQMYQSQLTRDQIVNLLGPNWLIVHDFGGDILLKNINI